MTTLIAKYLEDCPSDEIGNIRGKDGNRHYNHIKEDGDPHYDHLKHFLRLVVGENLPNDFGEYMDFASEAAKNVPSLSEDLLKYAFDICDKYFSPESLNNKMDEYYRLNILDNMDNLGVFLRRYADNPNRSIPQRGVYAAQQCRYLAPMVTKVASWYGAKVKNVEDKEHVSNNAADWRSDIVWVAKYCVKNWTPRDQYQEKNQNDMLSALADLPKGKMDDYREDMTGVLEDVYKQKHQLPSDEQRKIFDKLEQNAGVDGNEIFTNLYQEDKKWLKKNEAFIQKCGEKEELSFEDLYDTIDDVFSSEWKRRQASRTINAIEGHLRHDLSDRFLTAYHYLGILGKRPNIFDNNVFFEGGNDRLAELASDIIEEAPKMAPVILKTYSNIYQNSSVRKKGLNKDDYLLVEEAARKASKSRVQESKERIKKHTAEKEVAIKRYNENKNKKFYTADNLKFHTSDYGEQCAEMTFDNGFSITVTPKEELQSYQVDIVCKTGHSNFFLHNIYEKDYFLNNTKGVTSSAVCVDDYIVDVKDKNSLTNLIVGIQKFDQYGNLPQEYSEAENAVSGVIVADKIAEGIKNGTIYEPVTTEKGQKLSEAIKNKYMMNKKQNG